MTAGSATPPRTLTRAPGTGPGPGLRRRIAAFSPGTYLIMGVLVVLTIYPMVWMLLGSFKSLGEFYTNIWGLPQVWRWSNFSLAWNDVQLGQKFINSIIATLGTLILTLPLCSMAGYAFARVDFPLRRYIYYFVLAGIMIPFGVTAVPVLTTEVSLGLFDTRLGLILVYAAQNLPFGIFLMYSFFQSIPGELEEAALIDGCNRFKAFLRIVLPLAKPGLATLLIFTGTSVWNEYLMASVLIHQPNLETLPLGLVNFTTAHSTNYPELFAALSIVTAPVVLLYLVAQRQFISGLTAGALKG
ncbi:MAG TPA: carbohydrate ABC transporter permease [Streptosporangiaceae bacterium]|nr:carbohydrate ABC transporter permease [Streptosporangiaceae bacterium]